MSDCISRQEAIKYIENIQNLFTSVYYGINTDVIRKISDFVQSEYSDFSSEKLLEDLSLTYINPNIARNLRRMVIRYKFFLDPPKVDLSNPELRNNYYDQLRQYKRDVENFGPYISAFFHREFPSFFKN